LAKIKFASASAKLKLNTDIGGYLQAEYEKRVLSAMDKIQQETSRKINDMINAKLAGEWEQRKKLILEGGFDSLEGTNASRALTKTTSGPLSFAGPRGIAYAKITKALNEARLKGNRMAVCSAFANELRSTASEGKIEQIASCWDCLSHIEQEEQSHNVLLDSHLGEMYRAAVSSPQNNSWKRALVAGSRKYLELAFNRFIDSTIAMYPRDALLGGRPSSVDRIRAFVSVRIKRLSAGELQKLELTDGLPIWCYIFYLFRCGYLREAYVFACEHEGYLVKSEPNFISYLKAFIETEDNYLSGAIKAQIHSDYSQRLIVGNQDPFKMALLKILGRCDLAKKTLPDVILTTQDYIWLQLWLVKEAADSAATSSQSTSTAYPLSSLQSMILDLGPAYFNPQGNSPVQYFETLLAVGLFEDAVAYLFDSAYQADAVHFSLALAYHGTVKVLATPDLLSLDPLGSVKEPSGQVSRCLNWYKLISTAAKAQVATDPVTAIHYYLLLPLVAHFSTSRYSTIAQDSIRDVVLAAGSFTTLLGDVTADGLMRPGLIAKFAKLLNLSDERSFILTVTKSAALRCEKEDKYRDAIHLYNLAGEYEQVLQILAKKMSHTFAQAFLADAFVNAYSIAQSVFQFYQQSPSIASKIDHRILDTVRIHLALLEFKRFASEAKWLPALQKSEEIGILPLDANVPTVTVFAERFKSLDDSISVNLAEILLLTMTCIYQLFLEAREQAGTDLGRQQMVTKCRRQSRTLMVFVGMMQYRIAPDICSKLTRMDVVMN
jgi:nuclear pore complex protein Nup93